MVLYCFNAKDYVFFNVVKVLMVALVRTGFGTAFFISALGTLLSTIMTLLIYKLTKASIYGLSIAGALFHSLGVSSVPLCVCVCVCVSVCRQTTSSLSIHLSVDV